MSMPCAPLKFALKISVMTVTVVLLILAVTRTDHSVCVKNQENFYLSNWYKEMPIRARDAAYVYCSRNKNVFQTQDDI